MKNSYYELNDKEKEMFKEIENITFTDFEISKNIIKIDYLIGALYEMLYQYKKKCNELKNLEENIEQNYKIKNRFYEEYDINEKDFY